MAKKPFVPPPLPPRLRGGYSHDFAYTLSEASRAIGRLDGLSTILPNPKLLTAPFLRKEAVQSSSIEGTQATLEDVYKQELSVEKHPKAEADIREVVNYVRAMDSGLKFLKKLPISNRLVRMLHAELMRGVRGQEQRPGEFRNTQNYIAPPGASIEQASFVPPPPGKVPQLMKEWEVYVNDEKAKEHPLIQCGLMHYQFESIHPFRDGNGRIGRLLITLFLYERGLITYPTLYPSGYFEEKRDDYYDLLLDVSEKEAWIPWLMFFLTALKIQAGAARDKGEKILDLYKICEELVRANLRSKHAVRAVELVFANPFLTASWVAKHLGITHQASARILKQFVGLEILSPPARMGRSKIYRCHRLIGLLR